MREAKDLGPVATHLPPVLRTRPDISEETRAKIGGLNAQRFYGLS